MDAAHIAACSFEAWYPRFEHVTFRSAVLPLPPGFEDFLVQDGVFLPSSSAAMPRRSKPDEYAVEGVDYTEWSSSDDDADSGIEAAVGLDQFEGFLRQVDEAISALGGRVLPKLNWSAPKDAAWVSAMNTTACTNADEVLLLLQSSDRIAHDICHAFDACAAPPAATAAPAAAAAAAPAAADIAAAAGASAPAASASAAPGRPVTSRSQVQQAPQQQEAQQQREAAGQQEAPGGAAALSRPEVPRVLALRAWRDMRPGREFRCFVRGREIVGISQRDVTQRFEFLGEQRDALQEIILAFHEDHILAAFPLHDYTYDVYVTSRSSVKLIDFNPVGGATALLLFDDWGELGYAWAAAPGGDRSAAAVPAADSVAAAAAGHSGGAASGDAASAADAAAAQLAGTGLRDAAGAGGGGSSLGNGGSHANSGVTGSQNGHGSEARSQPGGERASGGGPPQLPEVDFRFIDEPVVMRSAAQGYCVPYDFVDSGVTGALADYVAQARHAGA